MLYSAREGLLYLENGKRFFNRPIYANHNGDLAVGGELPVMQFTSKTRRHGSLLIAFARGADAFWLYEADSVQAFFGANRIEWRVADSRVAGLAIRLRVVARPGGTGLLMRASVSGALAGDSLYWAFGGAGQSGNPHHVLDVGVHPEVMAAAFDAKSAVGNSLQIGSGRAKISWEAEDSLSNWSICAGAGELRGGDASAWENPEALWNSQAGGSPLAVGKITLGGAVSTGEECLDWHCAGGGEEEDRFLGAGSDFEAAWAQAVESGRRVVVKTPEPRLDALVSLSSATIDGSWVAPDFLHGNMLWNMPFPGWRTMVGATVYGWHERILETAATYLASQCHESDKCQAEADPELLMTSQSQNSRFFGKGRIVRNQGVYNMQSQFFDQLITAWHWTADAELEKILRPGLDLHLEWMLECFDPDNDGAYESYIDCWPTDSVWLNGGSSPDATSYAYRGHVAAAEMARRAGDFRATAEHQARAETIRSGFFKQLWSHRLGHPGKTREQAGHRRLHEDPWLYSIFLPIDAGLLDPHQAASTLHYSAVHLENDLKPYGGRTVCSSNWVPSVWSVRIDWPGDNYALALANFQTGFYAEGWEIFLGTFLTTAFHGSGPGNLGHRAGGFDFGDCAHPFARTLVEGLFGFRPDYPKGVVMIAPGFPESWDHALLNLPDVSISYSSDSSGIRLDVELQAAAALNVRLPLPTLEGIEVWANGQPAAFTLGKGIGRPLISVRLPSCSQASIRITFQSRKSFQPPILLDCRPGEAVTVALDGLEIIGAPDPQGVLESKTFSSGQLHAKVGQTPGDHLILLETKSPAGNFWTPLRLRIEPEPTVATPAASDPNNARWQPVDLQPVLNADVRAIFKQQYLTPRPQTVSVQLGTDGWTPWTSVFWKHSPPLPDFSLVDSLRGTDGLLATPEGARFSLAGSGPNIAFTSLWDNFPTQIEFEITAPGEAIWLLVAGSTNPMQCSIANAVLCFKHDDGSSGRLDLVPPRNFWALAPLRISGSEPGQEGRHDYTSEEDRFCVPQPHPPHVWLGENCRAMVYCYTPPAGRWVRSVSLECMSSEVVIGLLAASLMNPEAWTY